jgi:hypothetical protein
MFTRDENFWSICISKLRVQQSLAIRGSYVPEKKRRVEKAKILRELLVRKI